MRNEIILNTKEITYIKKCQKARITQYEKLNIIKNKNSIV